MARQPSFDGVKAKRDRAEIHLVAIETLIREFIQSDPYPLVIDPKPKEGRYLIKVRDPKPFPAQQLALVIGDCVHNMRSALDYIAWEFAGADPKDTSTMFPIFDDGKKFKKHGAPRIKRVRADARAIIESVQPYRTPDPQRVPIWCIENLDVADKHKLLAVTIPIPDSIHIATIAEKAGTTITHQFFAERLEHDTVIAVVSVSPPTAKVDVHPYFTPKVWFGDEAGIGSRRRVEDTLRTFLQELDGFINWFTSLTKNP